MLNYFKRIQNTPELILAGYCPNCYEQVTAADLIENENDYYCHTCETTDDIDNLIQSVDIDYRQYQVAEAQAANKNESLVDLLEEITKEVARELIDYEYRGLYLANESEEVMNYIKSFLPHANFNNTIFLEIGYNYSDAGNILYMLKLTHKSIGFELMSTEAGATVSTDQLHYFTKLIQKANLHLDKITELYELEYKKGELI